jgi:pseudouridine-5'-phosphate glycosidase
VLTGKLYTSLCVSNFANSSVVLSDEVRTALDEGRGVVALETTIVVHGLLAPTNLEVAASCESAVRMSGSVPATIGVLDGRVIVGLSASQLEQLAAPLLEATKLSARDVGMAVGLGRDGATTVAGTITVAQRAGICVMATGGLGGVHREAQESFDESADLTALSRTSVLVVASGVKSILDIGATLERLDTLGVPVVGYATTQFPGFYRSDSGFVLDWSVASAREAAAVFLAHRDFSPTGMLLANPVALSDQLDADLHERALASAFDVARTRGVSGKEVTPVLLAEFARFSAGLSVHVNRNLVIANAKLAGEVAHAVSIQRS